MLKIATKRIHNTALLFMLIAPFAIIFYATYVFNPIHAGNPVLYIIQLFADSIAITTVSTLWVTILLDLLQPEYHKKEIVYPDKWIYQSQLSIDVLIPVRFEALPIVERTIRHVVDMDYPHNTYMLDDGPSDELRELADRYKIQYIARPPDAKKYAKSGNLNYGLQYCKGEFFAVFDADHAPKREFLDELLPFFANEKVALVQTPQHYTNTDNFIASGTAQAQEIFYKFIQPAKNSYNASFCVGTNMIFNRKAIDRIGGITLIEHSEDIWTSILLHQKGYETVFYNKILAEGRAPEAVGIFFRQQNRWAQGGFSIFFMHNPLFVENLTIDQRLQYFFSNIHYFSAFAVLAYLILPIIYLLYGLHPMDIVHNQGWLLHYIPYFLTIYFIPFFLLGSLRVSTISTSLASFYPYIRAFFAVILKNRYTWITTGAKQKQQEIIMIQIWPHVFLIILSCFALFIGWYNPQDIGTTAITSIWVFLNAYFLFLFVKSGIAHN
jgi:cellulose synthase (UDP-forming)